MNSNEIKELKKLYKKTNKDIAEYCGVKLDTVNRWTMGSRIPNASAKILLHHFFEICYAEIVTDTEE